MICLVDTSAFYAVLDAADRNHAAAHAEWERLLLADSVLVTTSYVLVETLALLQHRIGLDAVRTFHADLMPLLRVEWIGEDLHEAGLSGVLSARRSRLSAVDCVSFAVMRRLGIDTAFAFDAHFREQGFTCLPATAAI